jgi:hypothetical protein
MKKLSGFLALAVVGLASGCGGMVAPLSPDDLQAIYDRDCTDSPTAYCVVVRVGLDGQDSGPTTAYDKSLTTLERTDPLSGCMTKTEMGAKLANSVPHTIIIGANSTPIMLDPSCPNATTWKMTHELTFPSGRVARGSVVIENVRPKEHYFASIDLR